MMAFPMVFISFFLLIIDVYARIVSQLTGKSWEEVIMDLDKTL